MAGHNQWSKVKYFMGAIDAKPGQFFGPFPSGGAGGASFISLPVHPAWIQHVPSKRIAQPQAVASCGSGSGQIGRLTCWDYALAGVVVVRKILTENKNGSPVGIRTIYKKIGSRPSTDAGIAKLPDQQLGSSMRQMPIPVADSATAAKIARPLNTRDACNDSPSASSNVDTSDLLIEAVEV